MTNSEIKIKCLVWDLDNTLWDGVLVEDSKVRLKKNAIEIIKSLDIRGILQSIASKNNFDQAITKLKELGIDEYFIYPEIHWDSKSTSIKRIKESINIGMDTIAFIDDQPFEREEVNFSHPEVLTIDACEIDKILDMPEMNPTFITKDSKKRRQMYQSDIIRNKIEENFQDSKEEFLASLNMDFTIAPASEDDLQRAEELTVRTNQLNTTGYTYSYDELNQFRQSKDHILLIAGLNDKYGTYGKIGLTLIEIHDNLWRIKLLLMSCRVMSRGVGNVMINYIMKEAKKNGVRLQAEFVHTDVNRMMYITYKFANFAEKETKDNLIILENDLSQIQPVPDYIKVNIT